MEDRQSHPRAFRVDHGLSSGPHHSLEPGGMQQISENGARPVARLGGHTAPPLRRLGALVFQPHHTEPLYWASLRAPTRIAGCAWGHRPQDTRWKNVPSELRCTSSPNSLNPKEHHPGPGSGNHPSHRTHPPTISFSLWTVVAEHTSKTPGRSLGSGREWMHPHSTDELSAQVALLQSPILSAAARPYRFDQAIARPTTTMN
jgi:hypothetical protein